MQKPVCIFPLDNTGILTVLRTLIQLQLFLTGGHLETLGMSHVAEFVIAIQ